MSANSIHINAEPYESTPAVAHRPEFSAVELAVICTALLSKLGQENITLKPHEIREASRKRIKLSRTNGNELHFKISRRTPGQ